MKRLLAVIVCFFIVSPAHAFDRANWFSTKGIRVFGQALTDGGLFGAPRYTTALLPTCNTANKGAFVFDTTTGSNKSCDGSTWNVVGGFTGGTVSGATVFSAATTFGSALDAASSITFNQTAGSIEFEGSSADANEIIVTAANATVGDQTWTIPNAGAAVSRTFMSLEATQSVSGAITGSASWTLGTGGEQGLIVGSTAILTIINDSTQTPDTPYFATGTTSNSFNIGENGDEDNDLNNGPCGTAACTDPTVNIHSAANDTTQYLGLAAWGVAGGSRKTLTESSATSAVRIPVAASAGAGGTFNYCIFASDATDQQQRCGRIKFSVTNKAGTETCGLNTDTAVVNDASISETEDGNAAAISTGTLTYAITCDTTPTNAVDIQINAVSSLTQTTLEARYYVFLMGPGQPARQ